MHRRVLSTISILSIAAAAQFMASAAQAQQDMSNRVRLKGPVKYAGIYHYGLGTWTRPGALGTELGPNYQILYNNTCSTPFFGAIYPGETWTDEGRLPGTNSPDKIFNQNQTSPVFVGPIDQCPVGPSAATGSARGSAASYSIDGFQIGYCSGSSGPTTAITLEFRETTVLDLARCAAGPLLAPAPQGSFALTGLPGDMGIGIGCWVVSLDLAAASLSFPMAADGNGNYATPSRSSELAHCFEWSFSFPGAPIPTTTSASGLFIAGAPADVAHLGWLTTNAACSGYDGTVWDLQTANAVPQSPINGASGSFAVISVPGFQGGGEDGTGMSAQDAVRIDVTPASSAAGCYFFNGPGANNAFASFHLELYSKSAPTVSPVAPGTGFCYGDGCAFICPCVPPNLIPTPQGHHESGCANAFDIGGATLTVAGTTSPDTVGFTCVVGPFFVGFGFLVKGSAQSPNGVFPSPSDGVRCANGALVRFGSHNAGTNGAPQGSWTFPNSAQTTPVSIATAQGAGQTVYYQLFYRNVTASFCSSATTNFSNGMIIRWP